METIKRAEFERNAAKLRQVAQDLRQHSPSVSAKADALASDLEIRVRNIDRGMTP